MSVKYSTGKATAYAAAVMAGYSGTFEEFCAAQAAIADPSATASGLPAGSDPTAAYNDGVFSFGIPKGDKGDQGDQGEKGDTGATGATGNGIASIAKTGTAGLVDTYTITYTNGQTMAFTVTNGADGNVQGSSIADAFDSTKNYARGDMVIYSGQLYIFKSAHSAGAWIGTDAEAVSVAAQLATKANTDGYYQSMTVGNAEQLVSTVGKTDESPYLFRPTGGNTDVGDRMNLRKIVGVSVPWNQYLKGMNATNYVAVSANATVSISDNVATVTAAAKYAGLINSTSNRDIPISDGHKTLCLVDVKLSSAVSGAIKAYWNEQSVLKEAAAVTTWQTLSAIISWDASKLATVRVVDYRTSDFDSYQVKNCQIIDLTLTYGSAIADYLYTLESATPGSGIAKLKSWGFFRKPYYAYNAGAMLSVSGLQSHDEVEFNQWDEEWEVGSITAQGADYASTTRIRSKGYNPILPNTTYYVKSDSTADIHFYDADHNHIYPFEQKSDTTFVTPADAAFFRFCLGTDYGTTYKNDVCFNLHWDGEHDGEYRPFVKHSYPLDSSLTLRGVPELDANNNLRYNGDWYEPDGTVTRRAAERAYQAGDESLSDAITDGTTTVYLLTAPTTETAEPYQETQVCDDFGTEAFAVAEQSGVAIPVGSESVYNPNLRAKLEMAPDSPDGDGDYLVRQTDGQNEYVEYVSPIPTPPSEDGTYTLKVTVSGSTVTKTWVAD